MPANSANADAATNPVAENYAAALFALAQQTQSVRTVNQELSELADVLRDNPQLAALFAHRTIDAQRRAASIRNLLGGRVSDLTLRFLLLLNDKGRLDQVRAIAAAFDRRTKHAHGEVDVEVHTARPLDAAQLQAVGDRISAALGKTALIRPKVDEALIGGLKVRVGDRLIDGSVRAQLRRLATDLRRAGHEQVKAKASTLMQAD